MCGLFASAPGPCAGRGARQRFYTNNPSRAADAEIRARENSFFQRAAVVISDIERIESSTENAQRADTAQERRDARGEAVAARHDAKRAFPRLKGALGTEIVGTSSADVDAAARAVVECIHQYLRGNTVSEHLHPAGALAELRAALHDQAAWEFSDSELSDGELLDDELVEGSAEDDGVDASAVAEVAASCASTAVGERPVTTTAFPIETLEPADASVALPDWSVVAKRGGDPEYRERLLAARYEPHVAPINRYVDALREESGQWLPYVAPTYGGVDARLLSLFQDPGPKTRAGDGTGMLSVENPDNSAARYLRLLTDADIDVRETLSWNSYPWYINRPPSDQELDTALPVLVRILEMLPRLEVVMLQGGTARQEWKRLTLAHPEIARRVPTIATYHTSPRVIAHVTAAEAARREQKLTDDFAHAKSILTRA